MQNSFASIFLLSLLSWGDCCFAVAHVSGGRVAEDGVACRWRLDEDGIALKSPRDCQDYMSMGSRGLDAIVEWAISAEGVWSRKGLVTFPTLRVGREGPGVNSTRGSWRIPFGPACSPRVNGRLLSVGSVASVRIGSTLRVEITHDEGLVEIREIFPANTALALLECVELRNVSGRILEVVPPVANETSCATGVFGRVVCEQRVFGPPAVRLAPGGEQVYVHCVSGRGENDAPYVPDVGTERAARQARWAPNSTLSWRGSGAASVSR